ncbi:MAG: peptidoglycan DD-metalloendopeptidase family protein [Beijerinckiaceae bacterium]|nr:peptidoglycan DD-metalloendopeptidase family protein [Beijerinckiaceae bacterium]
MMRSSIPAAPRVTAPTTTGSVASAAYPALAPVAPRPTTALGASQGWTAVGGTPVVLQQGEGLGTLSTRYGVPVSALLAVNGLSSVNQAQPGQQIMIPAYNAVQGAGTATAPAAPRRLASAAPVPSRETLTDAAPARPVARAAVRDVTGRPETEAEKRAAAKLKQLKTREADDEDETPTVPSRTVPKAATAQPKPVTQAATQPMPTAPDKAKIEAQRQAEAKRKLEAERKAASDKKLADQKVAEQKLAEQKRLEAERKAKLAAKKAPAADPETTASIPEPKVAARTPERAAATAAAPAPQAEEQAENSANFRWPAQGRVIAGFGAKSASGNNDGINIAVPEGTPVRAAEGGTVIHADDALKGYGKLVLVRHPNGYVSVYAHNGEIKVKRGESVKRGQVIAASGSSGNVTSPQLHFQIRKGSQAVDPMKVLSSN